MKKYLGYVIIESKEDLTGDEVIWSDENAVRIYALSVIHNNGDFDNFPQFYKYSEAWDTHSCPDYWPVRKGEILEAIDEEIKYWEKQKAEFNEKFSWGSM